MQNILLFTIISENFLYQPYYMSSYVQEFFHKVHAHLPGGNKQSFTESKQARKWLIISVASWYFQTNTSQRFTSICCQG
jgi:hypothetical protein